MTREVEVECLPTAIPQEIHVDVSEVRVGHNSATRTWRARGDVKVLEESDRVIISVAHAKVEAEAVVAGAEVVAEPEVSAKGKKEEEKEPW